jgi:metallo-beta-lactamase class B
VVRALPCDVQLGDHGAQFGMQAKFARIAPGAPNPYIDPAGCKTEMEISEAMVRAILAEQEAGGRR